LECCIKRILQYLATTIKQPQNNPQQQELYFSTGRIRNTMTKKETTVTNRKRTVGAVSLESFAQRKGHVRALEEFKKRKEHKRVETAKALRKYRKVMKQEGMEAGKGASRKRSVVQQGHTENDEKTTTQEETTDNKQHLLTNEDNNYGDDDDDNNNNNNRQKDGHHRRGGRRPPRINPFQKSLEKANEAKIMAAEIQKRQKVQEKERKMKLFQRKRQTKLLQQRTKRGQPIMKHMVDNLLHKIEKQQQGEHH
jgi:hypothetical protein